MYIITNSKIVTENEILEGYDLVIEGNKISNIALTEEIHQEGYKIIDAKGSYTTPGFIDIHSDYIESITSPRPGLLIDLDMSIKECEKIVCSHGITTMYHSLSFFGEDLFTNKPIRNMENVYKLINIIDETNINNHLIRHRLHARLEIDNIHQVKNIKNLIKEEKINLLSFMDHTPGQGQYRDLEIYKDTLIKYNKDFQNQDLESVIEKHQNREKIKLEEIKQITQLAKENNIAIASHDDDTIEKIEFVKDLGMNISEFPITMEVANKAKSMNMFTIAGSPNVVLGGSHSGNLNAADGVINNNINILCSDYYPASMLHSVFILHEKYNMPLHEMFKLVTINPARAVKIDNVVGSIEVGKKADILIIDKAANKALPKIDKVFVDGKLVCEFNYRKDL